MMIKNFILLISLLICFNVLCDEKDTELGSNSKIDKYQVSIYRIIANPDKFENKPVLISGYIKFEFGLTIYPEKQSCLDSFYSNGISISISDEDYKKYSAKVKNCKIMSIFGTYEPTNEYGKEQITNFSLGSIHSNVKLIEY